MTPMFEFISLNPYDTFDHAAPWTGRLGDWDCLLEGSLLHISANSALSAADAARLARLLRDWEAAAYLRDQHEIVFRSLADGPAADKGGDAAREHVFRRFNATFPPPDPTFVRTPLVEQLLEQIRLVRDRSTDLVAAVRVMVSALDDAYNIAPDVIETLNQLVRRPDSVRADSTPVFRGPEWQWMQEALRLVTLQAGRRTSVPPLTRLTSQEFKTRL